MAGYRKRTYNVGWWQTQQDRFQVTGRFPPVPFQDHSLSAILPDVLEKMDMRQDAWRLRMAAEWKEMVGDDVASYTRPGPFEYGRLIVYVRHSLWLAELSRYGKSHILAKLQDRFGANRIRQIMLRLDPDRL